MEDHPDIVICAGSDCARDERKRFKRLANALGDLSVTKTKCLGVCEGPVAVLAPCGETPVVVERIRKRHLAELRHHAIAGTVPNGDSDLRITTGKAVVKAHRKLAKILDGC